MTDQQLARNLGSNYTTFRYDGKAIAYLEMVADSGQSPVAQPQAIIPLGYDHPAEIVTPRALNAGTLVLSIREKWNEEVWEQLAGLAGTHDLLSVFRALAQQRRPISCTKIVTPPNGRRYGKTYHGCVITDIQDGETYDITTLTTTKNLTIYYTHTTPL